MNKLLILFLNIIAYCYSYYDVCIVGASSGLGKELVFQSLYNKKLKVLALTSNLDKVKVPYRGGGLDDKSDNPNIIHKNLRIENYWKDINYFYDYKNIIFTTSSTAFSKDYSYFLTQKMLDNLSTQCSTINLVSAYGAGDSLKNSNIGIKLMEGFYLKDVYKSKNRQEELINNYERNTTNWKNKMYIDKVNNINIKKNIYRPKVLTFGRNIFNGQSRENLANEILNNLEL